MNSIKTGSTVFRLKQTHVELISETVRQSFFQGGRNGFDKTSSAVTNMSWNLLHSIFSKQKSLTIAAFTLAISRFFFYLIENDTLKHKQQHPKVYTPQFVWRKSAHSGETVWPLFSSTKKRGFTKTFSTDANTCWYFRTLFPPNNKPWA